jgi:hypothetical protein
MLIELLCGHTQFVQGWPQESYMCEEHSEPLVMRVKAVECREWKVKCASCAYARWCGQSQSTALTLAAKHSHGIVMTDYLMKPEKLKHLRMLFGRKVQARIMTGSKSARIGRYEDSPPVLPGVLPCESDEPPF